MIRYVGLCTCCLLIAVLSLTPAIASNLSFSGNVFFDVNNSGSPAAGDPHLPGEVVNLVNGGTLIAVATTDLSGNYSFTNVPSGAYSVALEPLGPPWHETFPSGGSYNVSSSTAGLDFGLFAAGSIFGHTYNDLNGNGAQNPGEPGLSGWTVNVMSGGNLVATTTTDALGNYHLIGLSSGSYSISEVLMPGWTQTQPSSPSYSVTLSSTTAVAGEDFGNHLPAPVPEPSSLMLLTSGLAGFAKTIRRKLLLR